MTPFRVRAAALTIALTALFGVACSSGHVDPGGLPPVGTPAPNSPPGSFPDSSLPVAGTLPPPSGDAAACAGAPYDLTVRTGSGEDRTITERSSWAMYMPDASNWLFVTSDLDLPADSVRATLPDPAGQTLVTIRLSSTVPSTLTLPLAAGDRFEPSGTASAPNGLPVVDVQVRTAAGQPPSTAPLTGSVTVDAVTSEGVCLSVDLRRDSGAQVKGRIAAPFLSVNQSALTS
jgi:hypothetical protein